RARDHRVLRQAASVGAEPVRRDVTAERAEPGAAPVTLAARVERGDAHAIADLDALDSRAGFHDDAGELVAEDLGQHRARDRMRDGRAGQGTVEELLEVRPAEPVVRDRDLDFAGTRLGLADVLEAEISRGVELSSDHRRSPFVVTLGRPGPVGASYGEAAGRRIG